MSSPFFVVQAQRDLSLSRTLEIKAIADYNKALVDFEAVQQVRALGLPGDVLLYIDDGEGHSSRVISAALASKRCWRSASVPPAMSSMTNRL